MARVSLGTVIRNMINSEGDRGEKCGLLALVHNVGNRQDEIAKQIVTDAKPLDPDDVAEMFKGRAAIHSQDLEGVQYFTILAFYTNKSEPFTKHSFKMTGEQDPQYAGLVSEPASEKGLMGQHMRLLEGVFKISVLHSEAMINRVMTQNETLMNEQHEVLDLCKQLIMEKAAGQFDQEMKIRQYDRSTKQLEQFMKLAPPLINTITGKEVFPQGVADTALVEALAETVTEDQFHKLASILTPQQLGLLAARFEKSLKDKREARELAAKGPNGVTKE